jgi:ribosome-associated protein YbcJ (S4-like RNA binding protein)
MVSVNGETESRKRRKIIAGDRIQVDDICLHISD